MEGFSVSGNQIPKQMDTEWTLSDYTSHAEGGQAGDKRLETPHLDSWIRLRR